MFIDGDPFFKLALIFVAIAFFVWVLFQLPDFIRYLSGKGD